MANAPYDQRLANEAAAADQCMKLGGVLLQPKSKPTGFNVSGPTQQGAPDRDD